MPHEPSRRQRGGYTEVYGFVGWIAALAAYVIYLVWAYVPEATLHALGITYYPSKYWAIAVPSYLFVAVGCAFFVYVAVNLMSTAPLDSFDTVTDRHTRDLDRSAWLQQDAAPGSDSGVPNIGDINIVMVNRLLYQGTGRQRAAAAAAASAAAASAAGVRRRGSRPAQRQGLGGLPKPVC